MVENINYIDILIALKKKAVEWKKLGNFMDCLNILIGYGDL
jgi:hypothetical protein